MPVTPLDLPTTPFRGIGDFINFIGMLVAGGFIVLWSIRKLIIALFSKDD